MPRSILWTLVIYVVLALASLVAANKTAAEEKTAGRTLEEFTIKNSIQEWVIPSELVTNPFEYEKQIVGVRLKYNEMAAKNQAIFESKSGGLSLFIVDMPAGTEKGVRLVSGREYVLAVKIIGKKEVNIGAVKVNGVHVEMKSAAYIEDYDAQMEVIWRMIFNALVLSIAGEKPYKDYFGSVAPQCDKILRGAKIMAGDPRSLPGGRASEIFVLATCRDSKYRDGLRAVMIAQDNKELMENEKKDLILTAIVPYEWLLAAAYAESGEYSKAVNALEKLKAKVIKNNPKGAQEFLDQIKFGELLKEYKERKPARLP